LRAIVLDNEAVQALRDERHRKHRQVIAHLAGIVGRRRRGREVAALVPTAVRVAAGWDRTQPAAAAINRLRVIDHLLDTSTANVAATIISLAGVSVADAHVGAAIRSLSHDEIVVLTSDPDDIARFAGDRPVRTVHL
jgi:predicted nucleic acid-binding protein